MRWNICSLLLCNFPGMVLRKEELLDLCQIIGGICEMDFLHSYRLNLENFHFKIQSTVVLRPLKS